MKYEPKKVFVLQGGKYIEVSYKEFQKTDEERRYFLPLYGMLMEVSREAYSEYYRYERRQKYIEERAVIKGEVSYHAFLGDGLNGEELLKDPAEAVDIQAEKHIAIEELRNSFFVKRFGRNDFERIEDKNRLGDALAYIMKYIENSGEKIVYSRGLAQFFISDVMDEDILCPMGEEYQKLLLADDFGCWNEEEYIGQVSRETIAKMPKAN